jgi:hypothetical protein
MTAGPGELAIDTGELLFRQVHPSFLRDGRIGSQAFRPTRKDNKQLSVAQSSKTSPEAAFELHTECNKLPSAGTWAVTVGECLDLGLPVRPDEIKEPPCPDPAHVVIDFSALSNSKIEAHGTRLARHANERGRLHPAETPEPSARAR